ncbi:MAG: hypothetical protein ACPGVV_05380, partial [Croceimicrobium sp.]
NKIYDRKNSFLLTIDGGLLYTYIFEFKVPELNVNLKAIEKEAVFLLDKEGQELRIDNQKVFIFAGGELPISFLQSAGISVEKTFGKTLKKH